MKYALNVKKGTIINHPAIGKLVGGVAKEIDDQDAEQLKHIINIVIFDEVERKPSSYKE